MAIQEISASGFAERFTPPKLSSGRVHPYLIYGTAFKGDRTGDLTALALKSGFEGLDSANYPTAYEEALTGDAVKQALKSGLRREDILIQTKFSPAWAHDEGKLPCNADQPLEAQVRESIEQSFKNLKVDYIDVLMLHVPFETDEDNLIVWKVFESFVPEHVGALGVSNCCLPTFERLFSAVTIKPEVVQNPFHEKSGYDIQLRAFLEQKGVLYQAFHLLKANKKILSSDLIARFSKEFAVEKEVAFYLLVLALGKVSIINGTTSEEHMQTGIRKVKELLGNQSTVNAIRSYLGEFKGILQEIADLNT